MTESSGKEVKTSLGIENKIKAGLALNSEDKISEKYAELYQEIFENNINAYCF